MRPSLAYSDVRRPRAYTEAHTHLLAALNRAGIAFLSEFPILTDIWEPTRQRLKTFTVDVFIAPRLVIEVDGESHHHGKQWVKDEHRELWLKSKGYRVVRFDNGRVMHDTAAVVEEIRVEMGR